MSIALFGEPIQITYDAFAKGDVVRSPGMWLGVDDDMALVVMVDGTLLRVELGAITTMWRWDPEQSDWVDLSDGPLQDPDQTP